MIIFFSLIILLVIILLILLFRYYSSSKYLCPNCNSSSIIPTNNSRYKESPDIALWGSPDSYREYEYYCEKCNCKFWLKKKQIIIN